jgi:hypothetical protein
MLVLEIETVEEDPVAGAKSNEIVYFVAESLLLELKHPVPKMERKNTKDTHRTFFI